MASTSQRRIVQTYDYVDSQGTLLFQVVRFEPKDFRQRRPDGKGRWVWKLDGIEPVLYRLPEVLQAVAAETTTHIPEGERDVETLRSLGLIATCNPGGAGKWRAAYAATLRGGHVAILPDNDAPGRQHAEQVARALYGVAASLKIITLPGLPDKGDVSDWVAAGGTADALKALLDATPSWKPTSSTAIHVGEHAFNTSPPWPELSDQALYGLSGEIVRTIAPHTEADPVALLLQFLTMFGNLVGRTPYYITEADWHYLNLFACLVGETSKGRKGVSMGHPRRLLQTVDAAWAERRLMSGLSSGEGLIWAVRDPVYKQGKDGEEVCLDAGEPDKRLLVFEPEFARVLRVLQRDGNTLSAVLRHAWDDGHLQSLVSGRRVAAVQATHAFVSIIGHITVDELRRNLTETETSNGFANRFLWGCVRRSKLLPEGGLYPAEALQPFSAHLTRAVIAARKTGRMHRDDAARRLWATIYEDLSQGKPGLLGHVTARAEAQVLRLSCLYALLDGSAVVQVPHLHAALAIWRYCEASAAYIFGEAMGDVMADDILQMLRTVAPEGLTRTDLYNALGRNKKSTTIQQALAGLLRHQLVTYAKEETDGRPIERWYARLPSARNTQKTHLTQKGSPGTERDEEDTPLMRLIRLMRTPYRMVPMREEVKSESEAMLMAGIDPGLTGAVAILDGSSTLLAVYDTPTLVLRVARGTRSACDVPGMIELLRPYAAQSLHAVLEESQSMPHQGTRSMFMTGVGFGLWLGILTKLEISYNRVRPADWKRHMGLLGKDKKASRLRAMQWFPNADLRLRNHHGRAEALLLALYGRQLVSREENHAVAFQEGSG